MAAKTKLLNTVDGIINRAREEKIIHLSSSNEFLRENSLSFSNKRTVNFGSCSYLGLEFDQAVIDSSKKAIDEYGSQFSASRAYVSIDLYDVLEEKFDKIFGGHCLVSPTTTLGHIATIPVIIEDGDALIMDHQAHNSIHMAVDMLASRDIKVVLAKHNDMDFVEERIIELRKDHKKIWYLADGIYSMFGDACPVHKVMELMDKYPELHFYVDDAHGMSCFGSKGQGYVLNEVEMRDRMVVTASLAKAFATGGAVLIFPNMEMKNRVRNCGGPMITSGPLQPAILGAANKVADYHLSGLITEFQVQLSDNVLYANVLLRKYNLPLIAENESPIFFIGTGKPVIAQKIIKRMKDNGFFLNLGVFPAVPIKRAGIRFTITAAMTFEHIKEMINNLGNIYMDVINEENYSLQLVRKLFNLDTEEVAVEELAVKTNEFVLSKCDTIKMIDKEVWNEHFSFNPFLTWDNLMMMEDSFRTDLNGPENCWELEYLMVKDQSDKILLLTMCTTFLTKDDMLLSAEVSKILEEKRKSDPYYLTSKSVMLGTPLSEGQHFFIDDKFKRNEHLMNTMVDWIESIRERSGATSIIFRDFDANDKHMTSFFQDQGFFKYDMPMSYYIDDFSFETQEEFIQKLSKRSKKHFKQDVRRHEDKFICEIKSSVSDNELEELYELYMNVRNKSVDVNTFTLPFVFFSNINSNPEWELIVLYNNEGESESRQPVAVAFSNVSEKVYNFQMIGINYSYQYEIKSYQQMLYRVYLRAKELGVEVCNWGYTADAEKRKFGAKSREVCCYIQQNDTFKMQYIDSIQNSRAEELI